MGFAEVFYVNGDFVRGTFTKGNTLHGMAAKFDIRGRLLQLAHFDSGRRTGHAWQAVTDFGVAVYGRASPEDKGRISGKEGEVLLCLFSNTSDALAVTGDFKDSILQGQGHPRRLSKVLRCHFFGRDFSCKYCLNFIRCRYGSPMTD